MNNQDSPNNEVGIPFFIKTSLVLLVTILSAHYLLSGLNSESFYSVFYSLIKNFVFIPGIFVMFGLILKFQDREFKLSNAYYLGMLMSLVLSFKNVSF